MTKPLFLLISAACLWPAVNAQAQGQDLPSQLDRAWEVTWSRLYLPKVKTFGDYLSSYENGKEQAHLPAVEEAKRQYPNPCGYSTGMGDGAILGGAMLSLLCDRFAVTQDESLREKSASVLDKIAKKSPEDIRMLRPDRRHVPNWRNQNGYPNPLWGAYREIWALTREAGESALILLMVEPAALTEAQRASLKNMVLSFDYEHNSSCGIIYHLASYWKARRYHLLAGR